MLARPVALHSHVISQASQERSLGDWARRHNRQHNPSPLHLSAQPGRPAHRTHLPLTAEWNLMSRMGESYMWSFTTMGRCSRVVAGRGGVLPKWTAATGGGSRLGTAWNATAHLEVAATCAPHCLSPHP